MSLRSVEMQIAIPRTSEVGSVQNHLMHKPGYDQAAMAAKMAERTERELKRSVKIDEASAPRVRDERQGGKRKQDANRGNPAGNQADPQSAAAAGQDGSPYKGRHIDISI